MVSAFPSPGILQPNPACHIWGTGTWKRSNSDLSAVLRRAAPSLRAPCAALDLSVVPHPGHSQSPGLCPGRGFTSPEPPDVTSTDGLRYLEDNLASCKMTHGSPSKGEFLSYQQQPQAILNRFCQVVQFFVFVYSSARNV